MYGEHDLMLLGGKDPTKFARRCSKVLFTEEERDNLYLAQEGMCLLILYSRTIIY